MPPSGFNQKAINAILEITKTKYEQVLDKYKKSDLDEIAFLKITMGELEKEIEKETKRGAEQSILKNIKVFMVENYKDLVSEIYLGKDKYERPLITGKAIQKEINQINEYLTELKV